MLHFTAEPLAEPVKLPTQSLFTERSLGKSPELRKNANTLT